MQLQTVRSEKRCRLLLCFGPAITEVHQGGCSSSVQRNTVPLPDYNWVISADSPERQEAKWSW